MKPYLILIRPYGMLFLGLTPLFGAIANKENNPQHLLILCLIGILIHIFTFIQNDYYDIEIDQQSKYVANRPLTTGTITKKNVKILLITTFLTTITLHSIYLHTTHSLITLLLTYLCITLYNKHSKHYTGMEYILSLGVFTLSLSGSYTTSTTITPLALLTALYGYFQWLFSVGISANLKDVEFDTKQGITTTPVRFGTHINKTKLIIPKKFKAYAYSIKTIHLLLAPLILTHTHNTTPPPLTTTIQLLLLTTSTILLYCTHNILTTPLTKRNTMLIYIGIQEGLSFFLLPLTLTPTLLQNFPPTPILLLLLTTLIWPLLWFRLLYGKQMIPLE